MVSFQKKDVTDGAIGDRLRQAREKRGEDFAAVERATRIPKKFLAAIESNAFSQLPDLVYAKNFVRALAKHYGLDPAEFSEGLTQEMTVAGGRGVFGADRPVRFVDGRRMAMTPQLARSFLVIIVLAAIVGYFGVAVYRILRPPRLVVTTPFDNQSFSQGDVVVEGRTEPATDLTINSESVPVEADGSFKETLHLPDGISNLRIAGKKKHSKERELFLRVIVNEPEPVISATATPATGSATTTASATTTKR